MPINYEPEHIRTWANEPFRLELWDTFQTDPDGKSRLAYEFYHSYALIFKGDDFCASPLDAIDSDATVYSLLNFLSLDEGDTDDEYFDAYTATQLDWRDEHAETLMFIVADHENPQKGA